MTPAKHSRVWTITEAQSNLPHILHLAETEGPQRIETETSIVTLTSEPLPDPNRLPLGQWLVQNMPRGTNLVFQKDIEYERKYRPDPSSDA